MNETIKKKRDKKRSEDKTWVEKKKPVFRLRKVSEGAGTDNRNQDGDER